MTRGLTEQSFRLQSDGLSVHGTFLEILTTRPLLAVPNATSGCKGRRVRQNLQKRSMNRQAVALESETLLGQPTCHSWRPQHVRFGEHVPRRERRCRRSSESCSCLERIQLLPRRE